MTLEPFEFGVFLAKVHNGEHAMCLIGWSGDNGDPDNFYYPLLDQDSAVKPFAQNYSFWRDPAFHRLMLAGQRSVNEVQRRAIYQQAAQLVHDQVPAVSMLHTPVPVVLRNVGARLRAEPGHRIPLRTDVDGDVMHERLSVLQDRAQGASREGSAARRARRGVSRPQSASADARAGRFRPCTPTISRSSSRQGNAAAAVRLAGGGGRDRAAASARTGYRVVMNEGRDAGPERVPPPRPRPGRAAASGWPPG